MGLNKIEKIISPVCIVLFLKKLTKMDNIPFMHVLHSLTDLPHVVNNFSFGHCVAIGCNLFEQFSSR